MVMDSRMEREQLKTAVSSQRARYSIVSNTAVGYSRVARTIPPGGYKNFRLGWVWGGYKSKCQLRLLVISSN